MTKEELFDEVHALSMKARESGFTDAGDNLLLAATTVFTDDHFKYTREDIGAEIQALAAAAMKNGFKYTAWNLSYVALSLLSGEKTEIAFGMAMAPYGEILQKRFKASNFYWPENLD